MTHWTRHGAAAIGGWCLLATACLRAPIGDPVFGENGDRGQASDTDGPGAEDSTVGDLTGSDSTGDTTDSTGSGAPICHPSYVPCLPVVGDLDCPDVVALGAAPVTVVGPDEYGLDADGDGIGCEQ
ncbi:MAG: hypothetical protein K0V04_30140 [Deltaproteobacteria bacterium]|nr:hypothetical protein [Deltaproteobacteria bacterium]